MANLHMLGSVRDTINTSFFIRDGGYTLAIDGGFPCEADNLHDHLLGLGGVVDAWFLTHIHDDHVGALITMLERYDDVTVKSVYFNFPSDDFLERNEPNQSVMTSLELLAAFRKMLSAKSISAVVVNEGDVYRFGEISVRVMQTPDESITRNPINNSSCVFSFTVNQKKLLFLGDLGVEGGRRLLQKYPEGELRSDYVQMAHHGQTGVERDVYEAIRPRFCFWCTPSRLWDNIDKRKGGYDSGGFKTIVVRGWISEMRCVEKHYRMTDGTQVIEI